MDDVVVELLDGINGLFVNIDYGDVFIVMIVLIGDGFVLFYLEDVVEDFCCVFYQVWGIMKVIFYGVQEEWIWLEFDMCKFVLVGV